MEFCDKVKEIRKKLNLSQMALAKELGVAFSTVNRWESGKFEPNYRAIKRFEELCTKKKISLREG